MQLCFGLGSRMNGFAPYLGKFDSLEEPGSSSFW